MREREAFARLPRLRASIYPASLLGSVMMSVCLSVCLGRLSFPDREKEEYRLPPNLVMAFALALATRGAEASEADE